MSEVLCVVAGCSVIWDRAEGNVIRVCDVIGYILIAGAFGWFYVPAANITPYWRRLMKWEILKGRKR